MNAYNRINRYSKSFFKIMMSNQGHPSYMAGAAATEPRPNASQPYPVSGLGDDGNDIAQTRK
jgi:hypothetical protein